MATYKRGTKEAILLNLETAVNTVSGIQFVDWQRVYDQHLTKDRYPFTFINDVRIDKTKMLKDITKNTFMVGLVAGVWGVEVDGVMENVGTKMNTFMEALKDVVIADRSRNGEAYTTNMDVIETDAGNRYPQAIFVIMLDITFFSSE